MLLDTTHHRIRFVRPHSFAGLMTLYEGSYLYLRRLLCCRGEIRLPNVAEFVIAGEPLLVLRTMERAKYTSDLSLTYLFDDVAGGSADPDLVVRVYHDARLAEAISCNEHPRHHFLRPFELRSGSAMQRRWRRNILLHKWLAYLVEQGHGLSVDKFS